MSGLSDEEILATWESVTDFTEGWQEAIAELFSRLDDLRLGLTDALTKDKIDEIAKKLQKLRIEIDEIVESARDGEMSPEDLENAFRDAGEALSAIEAEVLELELEPDYEEDFDYGEEEF
ncbi:MAG: hypothetical protein J7L74_02920 [Candidatus Hydrothermae bacterium]|uniref:Uncharacterized protein n=1 Tax=candidate division WOR-3 bacterium TaxID=2052148 RepID=A0A7C1BG10_UNCW3|nr:hypothetical protein [Candidatus Hydrothermae bacterium]MCD6382556.1 hypothetical protein [Candidatus Hydrothermae bacterium]RKY95018.1 MAG: hypothetical protein DRQ06_04360 [Candidatus Hydrothermae bacterium]HDM90560.1 hypothetical protein [candidate division WOR-3 bacterium]